MASAPQEVWGDLATTAFVQSSHLFKSLDPDAMQDLLKLARVVSWGGGETISPEQDEGFYLVLDGTAAVVARRAGDPVELAVLERGGFFGECRVLGTALCARLDAHTDVTAVVFPAPILAAFAERFPKLKKLLGAVAAGRERDAAERLA